MPSGPLGAFLYLTGCSIKNRVRVRLRRLRQPRYLIGSIVGVLYFYYFVFGGMRRRSGRGGSGPGAMLRSLIERFGHRIELLGAGVLLVITALGWLWPASREALTFSRSEVQFLFTAPLTRRQLLHFKLLRTQLGALLSSALVTLLFRPGSLATSGFFLVGVWLLTTTLSLHLTGVSLLRSSLASGRRGFQRQWVSLVALLIVVIVLVVAIVPVWRQLVAASDPRQVVRLLYAMGTAGPASIVLQPFRWLVRVPLSQNAAEFLSALPLALLLLVLNYVWVIRAETAFEEAAADAAERRAQRRAGVPQPFVRRTAAATPFTLAITGRPEIAIVWKNLILLGRYLSFKMMFRFVPALIAFAVILTRGGGREGMASALGTMCLFFSGLTVVIGPQMARNDLRHDLGNLAMLKSWPMRGAAVLRGEVLASASLLSVIAWLWILTSAVLLGSVAAHVEGLAAIATNRLPVTIAATVLAPALILTQLVIQNGIAVMFPAWIAIGTSRARGIDAMGQRMIMLFGSLVAVVFAIVPAAVVAGLVGGAMYLVLRTIPIVIPAIAGALALIAECWAGTELLGRVFDRTDVAAVEAIEA